MHKGNQTCLGCGKILFSSTFASKPDSEASKAVVFVFLCRHVFHAGCAFPSDEALLPSRPDNTIVASNLLMPVPTQSSIERQMTSKIRYTADLRSRVQVVCPVCQNKQGLASPLM